LNCQPADVARAILEPLPTTTPLADDAHDSPRRRLVERLEEMAAKFARTPPRCRP